MSIVRRTHITLITLAFFAFGGGARADQTFELMEWTASGQFDKVIQLLAPQPSDRLGVTEQHVLCHAYAMSKRYDKLFPCLEVFESKLKRDDPETLLFALDDATPTVGLMRSQAYIELGRYADALREASQVVEWLNSSGETEPVVAIDAYAALALAEVFAGFPEKAIPQIGKIKKAGKSLFGDDYKNQRALALGRVYMALQEYAKVREVLGKDSINTLNAFLDNLFSGAFIRGRDNWLWQELPRMYMLNRALFGMGEYEQARVGYDRLLAVDQIRHNGEIYWMANFDRGQIADRLGDKSAAVKYYRRAIDTLEIQRATINTEANKIGFIGDKQSVYTRIIRLLIDLGRPADAFEYLERSRARSLVDLLAKKQDWRPKQQSDRVGRLLRQQLLEDEERTTQGAGKNGSDGLWQAGGTETVQELREIDPATAALVSVTTLSADQVRNALRPEDVLVEYFMEADRLFIFIVSREGYKVISTPVAGLRDKVAALRAAIECRASEAKSLASEIYDLIWRPVVTDLGNRRVLVVPHGPLHYLPFAALYDGQNYLIEKHAISLLPSASVLQFLDKTAKTAVPSAGALILGNPDLGSRRLNLPYAEKEAIRIAELLGSKDLLLKHEASESAFIKQSGQRELIHLASHGDFTAEQPLQSALLLAKGEGQDGRLTVDEIYGLNLSARLVTLSACETGLGKVASGDDVIGLIRGFIYAGASSVLASLWKVDDIATSDLMLHFYQHQPGLGSPEALRVAQRAMIGKGLHPFFWGAFYLTGR